VTDLAVDDIVRPIDAYLRTNLITAQAVARHMTAQGSGTILTLSSGATHVAPPGTVTYGIICTAIEAMTQRLAVDLGPSGIRTVCLRLHAVADAPAAGSFTGELFAPRAAAAGLGLERWLAQWGEDATLLGGLTTLAQVADTAVFMASDRAAAATGTVVDLTRGNAVRNGASVLIGVPG